MAIHHNVRDEIYESWKDAVTYQRPLHLEIPFTKSSEDVIWTESRILPIKYKQQTIGFIGLFLDISARKSEQATLKRIIEELSSERVVLQSALSSLEQAVNKMPAQEDGPEPQMDQEDDKKETTIQNLKEYVINNPELLQILSSISNTKANQVPNLVPAPSSARQRRKNPRSGKKRGSAPKHA